MRVLNLMWSSQPAYQSVHLVMSCAMQALQPGHAEHGFIIGDNEQNKIFESAFSLRSSKRNTKKWWSRRKLRQKIKQKITVFNPNVIILDGLGVARLVMPLLAAFPEIRVLVYFHGKTSFKDSDLKMFSAANTGQLKLVAVSSTLAEMLRQQVNNIEVLAIPTFLYLPDAAARKPRPDNELRLGAIGRLVKDKNFGLLIEMMSLMPKEDFKVSLKVAGEGEEQESLLQQIEKMQLENTVDLLGQQTDLAAFYQQVDVLLVPSLQEGQGLIVQEALHYGAVVFCSDLPVFREQLSDTGCYLPVDAAEEWAHAVKNISTESLELLLDKQRLAYAGFCNLENFHLQLTQAVADTGRQA